MIVCTDEFHKLPVTYSNKESTQYINNELEIIKVKEQNIFYLLIVTDSEIFKKMLFRQFV